MSPVLRGVLAAVALAAIATPLAFVGRTAAPPPAPALAQVPTRVIPRVELPPVEPIALAELAPQDARAFNAAIPFSTAPNLPARPFRLSDVAPDDRTRATDCLAAAVLYEAGDDPVGQRAVAQVVLNRVRHPAFPKSVCGVVFQGAERQTGCQFTFTCDGALARRYAPAAWGRAQAIAAAALDGKVERKVGTATHYHTDWVVPYWSASLDKIVEVNTHLFFRWTGWWGTPPAFSGRHAGREPVVAKMAALSPAHDAGESTSSPETPAAIIADDILPKPLASDANSFLVTLDPVLRPGDYAAFANRLCGDRSACKLLAWTDRADTPAALPATQAQIERMAFSYLRNRARRYERALWNCDRYTRPDPAQCMKTRVVVPARRAEALRPDGPETPDRSPLGLPDSPTQKAPADLTGIRRGPETSEGPPTIIAADGPSETRE
ncbi:cell wall hydrolase [Sphingomonas sp.]